MLVSQENQAIRSALSDFEKKIEDMHVEINRYRQGIEHKVPDWERLEMDLLQFSRKKISDLQLSKQLERIQYKFQNRKKIWLRWIEEYHLLPRKGKENP
jgi:tRNA A-37 threonylcarbamoyl transferase component Bud32